MPPLYVRLGALVGLLLVSLPGCAGHRFGELMRAWEGHRQAELFKTWGLPQYAFSDGQGGQVIVYTPDAPSLGERDPTADASEDAGPRVLRNGAGTSQAVYKPAMNERWPVFRIFFVGPEGLIQRSVWRGRWDVPALQGR